MAGVLAQHKVILKVNLVQLNLRTLVFYMQQPSFTSVRLPTSLLPRGQIPGRFPRTNGPGCADGYKPLNRTLSISGIPEMPARFQRRPKGSHVRETSAQEYFSFQAITQAYFNHSVPVFILLPAQSPQEGPGLHSMVLSCGMSLSRCCWSPSWIAW